MHYYFHYQAAYKAAIILHANRNLRLLRLVKQCYVMPLCFAFHNYYYLTPYLYSIPTCVLQLSYLALINKR